MTKNRCNVLFFPNRHIALVQGLPARRAPQGVLTASQTLVPLHSEQRVLACP